VDIVPIDDGREKRRVEIDREVGECNRNPIGRRKRRPVIRRQCKEPRPLLGLRAHMTHPGMSKQRVVSVTEL
jgi:hypothetical protein